MLLLLFCGPALAMDDPRAWRAVNDGRAAPGSGLPLAATRAQGLCNGWQFASAAEIAQIASFGFNAVRLPLTWANLQPAAPVRDAAGRWQYHYNAAYLAELDRVVADYTARGVRVILGMHQVHWSPHFRDRRQVPRPGEIVEPGTPPRRLCAGSGMPLWLYADLPDLRAASAKCAFFRNQSLVTDGPLPLDGFVAVWEMLARRYATNPLVVGADLLNEPPLLERLGCAASVADFYARVGNAVHALAPNWALIFQQSGYYRYQQDRAFVVTEKPAMPNAVYSWHFYPARLADGLPLLREHLAQAAHWDVPVFIGEFAGFGLSYNTRRIDNPDAAAELNDLLAYFRQNGVGWAFWEYGRESSLIDPNARTPKIALLELLQDGF